MASPSIIASTLEQPWRSYAPRVLEVLDPAEASDFLSALQSPGARPMTVATTAQVVLVGHRTAGKSRLLRFVARGLGRPAVDLDDLLALRHRRPLRDWLRDDEPSFRAAERAAFLGLPPGRVVSVGGGFLSLHGDLLEGHAAVLVPISLDTYRARLLADRTRPRLRPHLTPEEEVTQLYAERQALHARVKTLSLASAVRAFARRPLRVVTLPAERTGAAAQAFAEDVARRGADLLELRNDLHSTASIDPSALTRHLPLVVSERRGRLSDAWVAAAAWVDLPLEAPERDVGPATLLLSHHAEVPLPPAEAHALWAKRGLPPGAALKHVEPVGAPSTGFRLEETFARLAELTHGAPLTVLAMGPWALPFRCVMAGNNALDYLAARGDQASAPGQRLLDDAVHEGPPVRNGGRLGILGRPLAHSRSPRIHPPPFDRLELPDDVPLAELLDALAPHYRGFAVTSPFKQPVAQAVGAEQEAVNTLHRQGGRYLPANTDVDGAAEVLRRLPEGTVTALGGGGATFALQQAARQLARPLAVLTRAQLPSAPLTGPCVWTWPAQLPPPPGLSFAGATVAVIAYGAQARRVGAHVAQRGGRPIYCGSAWFVAQARGQRRLWEAAR